MGNKKNNNRRNQKKKKKFKLKIKPIRNRKNECEEKYYIENSHKLKYKLRTNQQKCENCAYQICIVERCIDCIQICRGSQKMWCEKSATFFLVI